jgi:hypothetical protein
MDYMGRRYLGLEAKFFKNGIYIRNTLLLAPIEVDQDKAKL